VLTRAGQPELNPVSTSSTFQNRVPQLFADVDRVKAKGQGVPLSRVVDTLQTYLGAVYIALESLLSHLPRFAQATEISQHRRISPICNSKLEVDWADRRGADVPFESDRIASRTTRLFGRGHHWRPRPPMV